FFSSDDRQGPKFHPYLQFWSQDNIPNFIDRV
ncbi:hypothetical protein AVEN_266469-1, partial [Araneus ventricosus]